MVWSTKRNRAACARGWDDEPGHLLTCSDKPDTSLQQQAALMASQVSADQLAWGKQIYADQAPARADAQALATKVGNAQLETMGLQNALANKTQAYQENTFQPIEKKIAADAIGYDTPARRELEAGNAMSDADTQFGLADAQAQRDAAARGVSDPTGGNMGVAMARGAILKAASRSAAGNDARRKVETVGAAKMADAANLGRGIASSQGTQAGLALAAGNNAVANTNAGFIPGQQAAQTMNSTYAGAQSGLANAGQMYGDISKQQAAASAGDAQGLGSAIGTGAALIL